MADPVAAQRGTRDILPDETRLWACIEDAARRVFDGYHYREIRTPIFEATELFARGIGEATDIVSKEMYTFTDRGDRSITLRPEGTAGVVRAYLQAKLYATAPSPLKLWYQGPMFRYERPQAGRQRQFHQIGVEALGSADPKLDAEVIVMALDLFERLEVPKLRVELNSLGCAECRPTYRDRLVEFFARHRDAYCSTCQERMGTNPLRVLDCKVPACRELNQGAPSLQDVLCQGCRDHQDALFAYLDVVGVPRRLNPRLVRGLDYYTRTVFEIIAEEKLGSQDTLAGGGRYDRLVEECGGPPTPAVGWAFGMERLAILLGDRRPADRVDLYVAAMGSAAERAAFGLVHGLRASGRWVVETAFGDRKLKKAMETADKLGATWALVIGDQELEAQQARLKHLARREEVPVALSIEAIERALEAAPTA